MLSHFGLCAGLYLVSVSLSFGSMQGVCKKYSKHKEKQHVLAVLLMFLMLCLTMFARYFCGVAVAFEWYFWWCMGGLLLVGVLVVGVLVVVVVAWHVVSSHDMGRYFSGVLHLCAQTQYTSIHNIKQSCTLVAHDISSAFPVLAGMTASVACDIVNKCKISSKKMGVTAKTIAHFPGKA